MLQLKPGSILVSLSKRQKLRLSIKLAKEGQAHRSSRAADAIVITVVFPWRFRSIGSAESVRQDQRWMARKIRSYKLLAVGWRDDYIQVFE